MKEVKSKVYSITFHEGPEGEKKYSSTPYLTFALDRGWVVINPLRPLPFPVRDVVPIVQEAGWAPRPF